MSIEKSLKEDDFIVSKTDLKGRITYGNRIFTEISGYKESELLGKPHNILRHPDMPKVVFKLLWERVQNREEIFAFVKNLCKDGEYYWVFTNVTASLDGGDNIRGYYSVRRKPNPKAIEYIANLYKELREVEEREGVKASNEYLNKFLKSKKLNYDEFMIKLQLKGSI